MWAATMGPTASPSALRRERVSGVKRIQFQKLCSEPIEKQIELSPRTDCNLEALLLY